MHLLTIYASLLTVVAACLAWRAWYVATERDDARDQAHKFGIELMQMRTEAAYYRHLADRRDRRGVKFIDQRDAMKAERDAAYASLNLALAEVERLSPSEVAA